MADASMLMDPTATMQHQVLQITMGYQTLGSALFIFVLEGSRFRVEFRIRNILLYIPRRLSTLSTGLGKTMCVGLEQNDVPTRSACFAVAAHNDSTTGSLGSMIKFSGRRVTVRWALDRIEQTTTMSVPLGREAVRSAINYIGDRYSYLPSLCRY